MLQQISSILRAYVDLVETVGEWKFCKSVATTQLPCLWHSQHIRRWMKICQRLGDFRLWQCAIRPQRVSRFGPNNRHLPFVNISAANEQQTRVPQSFNKTLTMYAFGNLRVLLQLQLDSLMRPLLWTCVLWRDVCDVTPLSQRVDSAFIKKTCSYKFAQRVLKIAFPFQRYLKIRRRTLKVKFLTYSVPQNSTELPIAVIYI